MRQVIFLFALLQRKADVRLSAIVCAVPLIFITAGCKDAGIAVADDYVNVPGTVVETSPHFFLIKTDTASGVSLPYFYPLNLPEKFKINGLQIVFSGSLEVSPTVQYIAAPIRLSRVGINFEG